MMQSNHSSYGGYIALFQQMRASGVRVELVRTYEAITKIRDQFTVGNNGFCIPFLVIISSPGLGKSRAFEETPDAAYINNAVSAVGLYELAYINRDMPLVFDDIDSLLIDKAVINFLKVLANDRPEKTLCWQKQNQELMKKGIPRKFTTSSRLAVLCNTNTTWTPDVRAVFDRAKNVIFMPSPSEVHGYVGGWWDMEHHGDIFEYFGANLQRILTPSMRWYQDALREKKLDNNWRTWLLHQWHEENPEMSVAGEIVTAGLKGDEAVQRWRAQTGLGRASYFDYRKAYRRAQGSD